MCPPHQKEKAGHLFRQISEAYTAMLSGESRAQALCNTLPDVYEWPSVAWYWTQDMGESLEKDVFGRPYELTPRNDVCLQVLVGCILMCLVDIPTVIVYC